MTSQSATGGSFLLEPCGQQSIFIPEYFSEEQRLFYKTGVDFMKNEVLPQAKPIEAKEPKLIPNLLRKAGELGLLSIEIPEKFGGLGLDVATSMLVAEAVGKLGSFSVSIGAHVGIGSLPIVYYGNETQQTKYLPKLSTAEIFSAYALTEAGSGSDALGAKTKAVLSADGSHYVLNGSKQWITNAGFADIFIVFAKIDGDKFTGFIVERGTPGFTIGAEEHKMGIRGSSTCALTFEDMKVPKENVLGVIGKGHKIAFNILNHGRLKLGICCNGGSKHILGIAANYAKARKAFGEAIANFGLIQEKLADMAIRIFVTESMGYRTCGLIDAIDHALDKSDPQYDQKRFQALEEFNIETSILKVYGSETNAFVVDEAVQIHGGYGYSEEYEVERNYRDSRINRIFEGTNEVNRLLIPGTLFKRAMQGRLGVMEFFGLIQQEIESNTLPQATGGTLGLECQLVELAKRQTVYAMQIAAMRYMQEIENEQEILGKLANLCIDVFGMDSAVMRTKQLIQEKRSGANFAEHVTKVFVMESVKRVFDGACQVIREVTDDAQAMAQHLQTLNKMHVSYDLQSVQLKRHIAQEVLTHEGYPLPI